MTLSNLIFLFFLTLHSTLGQPWIDYHSACPKQERINPCLCTPTNHGITLSCTGPNIMQDSLKRLFALTKIVNNVNTSSSFNNTLRVSQFHLEKTNLSDLDLTPLADCQFDAIKIVENLRLNHVTFLSRKSMIVFNNLEFSNSSLSDTGAGTLLGFIGNPESIQDLDLSWNKIRGLRGPDLIHGLSRFSNLEFISLTGNELSAMSGGPFRHFKYLQKLWLNSNRLRSLEANAFLLDNWNSNVQTPRLTIHLQDNRLSDQGISRNFGLPGVDSRRISLHLEHNQFEAIVEPVFRKFLYAHQENFLFLRGNPIDCGRSQNKWLVESKERFQYRVVGAQCVGDEGKDLFVWRPTVPKNVTVVQAKEEKEEKEGEAGGVGLVQPTFVLLFVVQISRLLV